MGKLINLNADVAEGWGAYDIGDDAALMKLIRSANVACGFHAGDADTMHRLVMLAQAEGVSIGAHPGFNDLWGFGRRAIRMAPAELEYMIAHQVGALQALACYGGLKVTHLKAHGMLYNMAAADEDYAMAIGRAIKVVDANLIYVALAGSEMVRAAERLGLKCAREGFCDRRYAEDGTLVPRSVPGGVVKDADQACAQALSIVNSRQAVAISGKMINLEVDTLCVHGDEPKAVTVAARVKEALEDGGVRIVSLPELIA